MGPRGSGVAKARVGVVVVFCVGDEVAMLPAVVLVGIPELEEVMVWSGVLVGTAELKSEATSLENTVSLLARTLQQKARLLLLCDRISLFLLLLKCVSTAENVLGCRFLT